MPAKAPFSLTHCIPHHSSRSRMISTPSFPHSSGFHHPWKRRHASTDPHAATTLPPRWLSDLKKRVGKCIIFGLSDQQIDEAGEIMRTVARDWRDLVAGSEGFLTGRGRAGFEGREVVWGEMDVMVSPSCFDQRVFCFVDLLLSSLCLGTMRMLQVYHPSQRAARTSSFDHVPL